MLIAIKKLQKSFGAKSLFKDLSLIIHENNRIGLIGPNGSGKSTLLKIMAGVVEKDDGDVSVKKGLKVSYVAQENNFDESLSIQQIVERYLIDIGVPEFEASIDALTALSQVGFEDFELTPQKLSGGWRKRLAIAQSIASQPELLLLDEPTNHMDWDGIQWLESWLIGFKGTFILVSHDRAFLQNVTNRTIEINPVYQKGFLSFDKPYVDFLNEKADYIEAQKNLQATLANKVRREVAWLRAGVKARTTKSQSRINEAHQLIEKLDEVKGRNQAGQQRARLVIDSSGRKTKKLLEINSANIGYQDKVVIENLTLKLGPQQGLGVLGANGSGKSTLLKVLVGEKAPLSGEIFWAESLRVVYFDQKRQSLEDGQSPFEFMGDGSDYVIFQDKSIHVASYLHRFLFTSERLNLKISQLSGGERARLLIAKLLLSPADVLILDEPTNDLDIDTIEVLEEVLEDFPGLLVLVSHDRYFLARLCDQFLGLENGVGWGLYAEPDQWLKHLKSSNPSDNFVSAAKNVSRAEKPKVKKRKLSYKERRELESMEEEILALEEKISQLESSIQSPDVVRDYSRMQEITLEIQNTKSQLDNKYIRWSELEELV